MIFKMKVQIYFIFINNSICMIHQSNRMTTAKWISLATSWPVSDVCTSSYHAS